MTPEKRAELFARAGEAGAREKHVEYAIRVALSEAGILIWKHSIDMRSPFGRGLGIGASDLICVVPPYGRFLAIEVKRPGRKGRVSEDQRMWLKMVEQFNGIAGVATSVEQALRLVDLARVLPVV